MAANPREELIAYLAKLSDQEVGKLLKFAQVLHDEEAAEPKPDYDPSKDRMVGLFEGTEDASTRYKSVVEQGIEEKLASHVNKDESM